MNIRNASLAAIGPIVRAGTIRSSAPGARPDTRSPCDSFRAASGTSELLSRDRVRGADDDQRQEHARSDPGRAQANHDSLDSLVELGVSRVAEETREQQAALADRPDVIVGAVTELVAQLRGGADALPATGSTTTR